MNAPLVEPAHSRFGGSVATRVLRCPASVGLIEKVPAYLRRSSVYADRGTALHIAIALLLDEKETLESLIGRVIGTYTVTADDVENALRPAFAYITALLDIPGAEFYLEHRVTFPTIAGAFGTVDLIVRIGDTIHVIDLKFGSGVLVRALSPADDDPSVDVVNAQLAYYAAAARYSLREFFAGVKNIVLTIVQPVSIEPDAEMVSSVTVTHDELDEFIRIYRAAAEEALSPAPRLKRGDHCRFCAARPICPLHTAPLLDLAQLAAAAPLPFGGAFATPPEKDAYLQLLAHILDLADKAKEISKAAHDQAKRAVENGDCVPGYALSAGRAERHWRDGNAAIAALIGLGLERGDVTAEEMRSVKQVEIRAKARGLKIPQEFIVSTRSGVSLVKAENAHAPILSRNELAQSFSVALTAFQGGGGKNDD